MWIDKENLADFDENGEGDARILRIAIRMMKARIEELEEEIEDNRLEAIEERAREDC